MKDTIHNPRVLHAYVSYLAKRRSKLRRIVLNLVLCLLFTAFLVYGNQVGFKGVNLDIQFINAKNSDRVLYELPLLWFSIIVVQVVFYFAESIPGLKQWQDKLERKEFDRIKNTYEYQMKL